MKLLVPLLFAFALTLAWQTSVVADEHGGDGSKQEQTKQGDTKDGSKTPAEEPDCE
ncbi:MAG: hypothetical protein P8106_10840 [Gammaproteobacteria bacterium]|jgi:hypothetical protein